LDNGVPTFGLWYDFRQRPPLENMRLFASEVVPRVRDAVKA